MSVAFRMVVLTKDGWLQYGFEPRLVHSDLSACVYCSPRSFIHLHAILEEAQMGPRRQGVNVAARDVWTPKITHCL